MTNSLFAVIILLSKNDLKNNFKIFYIEVSFLMTSSKLRIGLAIDYVYSDYSIALLDGIKKACKDFNAELLIFPIGELNNISFGALLLQPYYKFCLVKVFLSLDFVAILQKDYLSQL